LEALAEDFQPDLILLTETWCNDNISDAALSLHGYSLETDLRRDRQDTGNGVGGGLLVYSRKGMKILPLDINNNFNQFCSFSTGTKRDSLNFVLAYRPPSSGTENTNKLCEMMRELPMNSVIIGDINMPGINWETMTSDNKGRALVETMEEEGMAQLVNFSTHIKGNILDLIITNCPERIISISEEGRMGKSDHSILLVEIEENPPNTQEEYERRNWRKANMPGLRAALERIRWRETTENMDIEETWRHFKEIRNHCFNQHVPAKKTNRKRRLKQTKGKRLTKNCRSQSQKKFEMQNARWKENWQQRAKRTTKSSQGT